MIDLFKKKLLIYGIEVRERKFLFFEQKQIEEIALKLITRPRLNNSTGKIDYQTRNGMLDCLAFRPFVGRRGRLRVDWRGARLAEPIPNSFRGL